MSAVIEIGLETIVGAGGRVMLGWVGQRIFYVRFVGTLSRELGEAFMVRLRRVTRDVGAFQYFSDARALEAYDVSARREFVDFVIERLRLLEGSVSLTWKEGVSSSSRAFVALVSQTFEVLVDNVEFEKRLFAVAPRARSILATLSEETSDPTGTESPRDNSAVRLLLAAFDVPSSSQGLHERACTHADRILGDMFRWLRNHDSYLCELGPARGDDSAPCLGYRAVHRADRRLRNESTRRHGLGE
jgi:hypothetical protein